MRHLRLTYQVDADYAQHIQEERDRENKVYAVFDVKAQRKGIMTDYGIRHHSTYIAKTRSIEIRPIMEFEYYRCSK